MSHFTVAARDQRDRPAVWQVQADTYQSAAQAVADVFAQSGEVLKVVLVGIPGGKQ